VKGTLSVRDCAVRVLSKTEEREGFAFEVIGREAEDPGAEARIIFSGERLQPFALITDPSCPMSAPCRTWRTASDALSPPAARAAEERESWVMAILLASKAPQIYRAKALAFEAMVRTRPRPG
jgi:hypothetical protein